MLPGFRFLFAAIVICMSALVFGLGATALMRAAHEDFATNTSWRAPPEPRFAEQEEAKAPVLAVLSLEPRTTEPAAAPRGAEAGTAAAPVDCTTASPSSGPDTTGALGIAATPAPDTAKSDDTVAKPASPAAAQADNAAPSAPPPTTTEVPQPTPATANTTAATDESKPAPAATGSVTIGKAPPVASESAPSSPPQALAPAPADAPDVLVVDEASTRIATLGGPPVPIDDPTSTQADAKAERDAINKKLQAEHAKEQRRRLAARRARLAQQQAAAEQAANPFAPHPLIGTPPQTPPGR